MDYSIFLLDAFMNYRKQGMNEEDAIINAVQEAINSIFASSLTTVVGFLALVTMKFSIGFDLGLVLAKGIVFSLLTDAAGPRPCRRYRHRPHSPALRSSPPHARSSWKN